MDFDPFKDPKVSPGILVHAPTESDLSVDRRDESNNNQDTSNHNINLNLNLGYNNNTSSAQSSTDELSSNTGTQRSISRRNPFRRNSSLSKSYSSAKSSHTPNLGREARTPSPERNNSSLFNEAAEDQDFEAIREGLSFALGNDNKDAEWFPVSSGFKATSSPERNNSNATSNEFLHSPSGINDSHLYSDNIPLDNLKISPNHTGEGTSPRPPLSARNQSFPSHLSPHDFNKRENLSPTSHSSNNIPKASKDPSILESGLLSPALNHPSSASSKFDDASPNKFSNVITRLSDRIAGTGAAASPVTDKPAQDSQLYRQKSNSSAHSSDHSSGGEARLDGKAKPYITRDGSSSDTIKGYRCPKFSKCVSGENPYAGTVNFDNILQSLEMVFIVMSANTFTDIMYYTMDSDNMAAFIVASFNITRMEADEQKKQRKRKKGIMDFLGIILSRYFEGTVPEDDLDDVDFPMHTLPNSFVALYVITSTENWSDILYSLQEYSRTTSSRFFGAMFLIGWFILSNMVILNIFIAVIAKTLEVSEEGKRKKQLLQFIDDMTEKLQNLDSESGLLSKIKKKVFRHKGVKDDLEKAVVNLLLSGTAVNEFLDRDPTKSEDEDTEKVKTLPSSSWKRWFQIEKILSEAC
ncbi:hypothetical protein QCA50_016811 [Cerrena zonata]|uniref:Ion transport domain-containing protein n=1 Tax=Cerrena zonata TaxID=2478898 RepID=A0AAW0FRW2_9APHY